MPRKKNTLPQANSQSVPNVNYPDHFITVCSMVMNLTTSVSILTSEIEDNHSQSQANHNQIVELLGQIISKLDALVEKGTQSVPTAARSSACGTPPSESSVVSLLPESTVGIPPEATPTEANSENDTYIVMGTRPITAREREAIVRRVDEEYDIQAERYHTLKGRGERCKRPSIRNIIKTHVKVLDRYRYGSVNHSRYTEWKAKIEERREHEKRQGEELLLDTSSSMPSVGQKHPRDEELDVNVKEEEEE